MSRDYKYRAEPRHYRRKSAPSNIEWRWLLVIIAAGMLTAYVLHLRSAKPPATNIAANSPEVVVKQHKPKPVPKSDKPYEPTFDFYTILPEQEVVVAEPEISTRKREESIGKIQDARYVIQAGSFRSQQDAEKVRTRLATLGIAAKIEAAKNGSTIWNRVKIGPLDSMTKVDSIRARLHDHGIDAVVLQLGR